MGTRNLTKVIDKNGVIKVAQYGQWDGYPSGQGVNALNAIFYYLDEIKQGIKRVYWISQDELNEIYASLPEMNYLGTEDNDKFTTLYPNLTRDTCAKILNVIAFSVGKVGLVPPSRITILSSGVLPAGTLSDGRLGNKISLSCNCFSAMPSFSVIGCKEDLRAATSCFLFSASSFFPFAIN